jgi:transposase
MSHATTFIGLDVHKATITAAAVTPDGELKRLGTFPNTPAAMANAAAGWGEATELSVVYEAGPCGYPLARQLQQWGIACQVIAPSLLPRRPGDRVKTDRRDAEQLAIALAKDLVTAVPVPSDADEALRALSRRREQVSHDLHRDRQRLVKFLQLQGQLEPPPSRWTKRWWSWLATQQLEQPTAQVVLVDLIEQVQHSQHRLQQVTAQLETAAQHSAHAWLMTRLQRFHGIGLVTAVGIVSECGDLRRFDSAPAFMAYTGLVPSEHSSGGRQQRGGITRTGNSHLRFLLGEAAWHYTRKPKSTTPPADELEVITQHARTRLAERYGRLVFRGKSKHVALIAIARELAGYLWGAAQLSQPELAD